MIRNHRQALLPAHRRSKVSHAHLSVQGPLPPFRTSPPVMLVLKPCEGQSQRGARLNRRRVTPSPKRFRHHSPPYRSPPTPTIPARSFPGREHPTLPLDLPAAISNSKTCFRNDLPAGVVLTQTENSLGNSRRNLSFQNLCL